MANASQAKTLRDTLWKDDLLSPCVFVVFVVVVVVVFFFVFVVASVVAVFVVVVLVVVVVATPPLSCYRPTLALVVVPECCFCALVAHA